MGGEKLIQGKEYVLCSYVIPSFKYLGVMQGAEKIAQTNEEENFTLMEVYVH